MDIKEKLEIDLQRYKRELANPALKSIPYNTYFTLYGYSQMGFRNYEDKISLPEDYKFIKQIVEMVKRYYEKEIQRIESELNEQP